MVADLGVGPGVLKKGAGDILESLKQVQKVDLEGVSEKGSSFGNDAAAAALVTFSATWQLGAEFLADCAATLADGLNAANSDFSETDESIRDAVNSVKSDLK
ncbi:hypothetical protein [Streptomyces sp. NPDC048202]|uniref:hypothetical protein n=1 Tax=unclassified Streptomyces TaxID=2593676 RepID=UPI00371C2619